MCTHLCIDEYLHIIFINQIQSNFYLFLFNFQLQGVDRLMDKKINNLDLA